VVWGWWWRAVGVGGVGGVVLVLFVWGLGGGWVPRHKLIIPIQHVLTPPPHLLAFTRQSFVYSGIVNWSILLLAFNTSFMATPGELDFAINIAQYMVYPRPPCVATQHTILVMAISYKGQLVRLQYPPSGILTIPLRYPARMD